MLGKQSQSMEIDVSKLYRVYPTTDQDLKETYRFEGFSHFLASESRHSFGAAHLIVRCVIPLARKGS